jgi:hypothetical protein
MMDALLEVMTDPFGYSAIACACLALTGFCMMVVGIVRNDARRTPPTGLLLAGLAYAAANVGAFVLTISLDSFAIFHLAYLISVGFLGPALMVIALIFVARAYRQLSRLSLIGYASSIVSVAFAHLWAIAAAAASV